MDGCKVAVIIPTLNEERFIGRCIESVVTQSFPLEKMDILVIDGGSVDRTKEIVLELGERYLNIRLLENPRRIQSVAFNIGVKFSDAPYIIRLDAHAQYDPQYIEICIARLQENTNRGNVGGRWDIVPQSSTLMAQANAILNRCKFGIGGASFRVGALAGNVDTVPFGAFPRSVIDKIGGMREDLVRGEDNEFNSRIRHAGYDVFFDPNIVCTYYARATMKDSAKQMYANGKSIGHLLRIDKHSVSLRHLVPLLFVLSIIGVFALSFVSKWFSYAFLVGLGVYLFTDVFASIFIACKNGRKYFFPLVILFFVVHVSYGWGTIIGIIKKQ